MADRCLLQFLSLRDYLCSAGCERNPGFDQQSALDAHQKPLFLTAMSSDRNGQLRQQQNHPSYVCQRLAPGLHLMRLTPASPTYHNFIKEGNRMDEIFGEMQ